MRRILSRLFGKRKKEEPLKEDMTTKVGKKQVPSKQTNVINLEDIIRAEGIGFAQGQEEKDVRYCYQCGKTIRKGEGYLLQGGVPRWMADFGGRFTGFTSLAGTSCEVGETDNPLIRQQIWYWYCNNCGSEIMAKDRRKILVNGAKHFWKTGKPPKRRPLIEGIDY